MHFNKNLGVVGNHIKEENIDKAWHEFQFDTFKSNNNFTNANFTK